MNFFFGFYGAKNRPKFGSGAEGSSTLIPRPAIPQPPEEKSKRRPFSSGVIFVFKSAPHQLLRTTPERSQGGGERR